MQFKMIAKTLQGLEGVLADELRELGAKEVESGLRMVSFEGDKEMMYRANFCLRTALRVLKPIRTFEAHDADEVYDAIRSMDWNEYLDLGSSFAVDSVVFSEDFKHSKFVAYKVKDAIVDFFRDQTGQRPNISVANPDVRLNIHIAGNQCTLSLDSSGESLHKRGYRAATVESPINEVLAAGILKLAGWTGQTDLIDPMCGSGTIAVEAALMARNIYPGVFHTQPYGFEHWKDFDADLLEDIYNDDSREREFCHKIHARDIDPVAVSAAKANARSAGVIDCMEIREEDFHAFTKPSEDSLLVMNPPYGERISSPDLLGLYRLIGEKLKHQFAGNDAWIISYRQETFDKIGLKPSLSIPLYNGALDCELRKYQIFDGKLKTFRSEGGTLKTDSDIERMKQKRALRPKQEHPRRAYGQEDQDGEIPEYLLRRHRSFVATQKKQQTQERKSFRSEHKPTSNSKPKASKKNRSPWAKG